MDAALEPIAAELGARLLERGEVLATAESCTGGWAAQCVTAIAGSSAWFDRGFVTYSNEAKVDMLGVATDTLDRHGAVSEPVAIEMARGALRYSRAQWALAISGIAGPSGGTTEKPVGTVCFAWAGGDGTAACETHHFTGDREAVRRAAVETALQGLLARLKPLLA